MDEDDLYGDTHQPYNNSKIRLNTAAYFKRMLQKDLSALEADHKFKISCGETDLLSYVHDGMKQLRTQLANLETHCNREPPVLSKQRSQAKKEAAKSSEKYVSI